MTDIPLQVLSDRSVLADRSVLSDRSVLAGRWTVVPDASECRFAVRDKLITTTFGTLPVTRGHVRVSGSGAVERSWVEVAVDRIETGNTTRDAHLCSPHILDAAAHPRIRVEWDRPSETQHGWTGTARLIARGLRAGRAHRRGAGASRPRGADPDPGSPRSIPAGHPGAEHHHRAVHQPRRRADPPPSLDRQGLAVDTRALRRRVTGTGRVLPVTGRVPVG
jgi:hypothetical protein